MILCVTRESNKSLLYSMRGRKNVTQIVTSYLTNFGSCSFQSIYISVKGVEDQLDEVVGLIGDVKRQARRVARLPGLLGLDAKIAAIRKNIELSRDRAGVVMKLSCFFTVSRMAIKSGLFHDSD